MTRNGTDGILFFTKSIVLIAEIPITMKKITIELIMTNISHYVQSLSSYKLGCILRPVLDQETSIPMTLLQGITAELKARNSYEREVGRRSPH